MKFTVKKDDLLPLLTRVNKIVEKKSTQKVNTHVLINASEGKVEFVGFDKEIKIAGSIAANVEMTGATTVSADKLFNIIKSIPDGVEASVQLGEATLDVVAGKSRFHLFTITAEDYPLPDKYEFEHNFFLPANQLIELLNQVKFSMANNDVRHYLNGLLLHFTQSTVVAVSTDGHRLSVAETENHFGIEDNKTILPRKIVNELVAWLGKETQAIQINLSDSHIQIVFDGMELTSTVVNADYPAYETVVPELAEKLIVLPKEDLRNALERAKILSSDFGVGVSLSFETWKLNLSAKNMENESVEDTLDINYDGEPIKTAFNITYLLDIISVISNDNLTLSLRDGQSSCLIYDAEKDRARYIVMPMNI